MRVFAWLLSLIALSSPSLQAEEPVPDIETITQALLHWQNSLKSVSLTYLRLGDPHSEMMRQSNMEGVQITSYSTFCWDDQGRKFYHDVIYYDGLMKRRSLKASDPFRFFQAAYPPDNSERERPVVVEMQVAKQFPPGPIWYKGTNEVFFIGLWYSLPEMWIGEMLRAGRGKVLGWESVAGVNCVALEVDETPPGLEDDKTVSTVYLHPEYHYLPWRLGHARGEPSVQITRYQEVAPGLFFPADGEHFGLSHCFWKLEEFAVNQPLDESLFEPPLGPGTQVQSQSTGEVWINGTEAEHQELVSQLDPRYPIGLKPLHTPAPPAPPAPKTTPWQAWMFLGLIGCVMVIVFAAMLRRQQV